MSDKSHIFYSGDSIRSEPWPLPRGSEPRVEDESLHDMLSDTAQHRLVEALDGYVADCARGVRRDPEELCAAHPELAGPLRQYLASLNVLQQASALCRPAPPEELPQLGDYRIMRELGRGGMGIVYEARQLSLGRTVALKVLPFAAVLDQKEVLRFQNEAQAAAQLHHPHIVPVYAVGCERGVHYYSMQFIDGQPLDRALASLRDRSPQEAVGLTLATVGAGREAAQPGPQTATARGLVTLQSVHNRNYIDGIVDMILQAADALQHAHECGVIHRDIKPSNLLVDRGGKIWISDFGLARFEARSQVTTPGDVFGTLRYMSPEQAAGRTDLVDGRSDLYALGVTLYEALTLRLPFDAPDRGQLLRQILHAAPPALRPYNSAIPVDLETIVLKTLAKSREERYATVADLAADLRRFRAGQPTLARRPTLIDHTARWVVRQARLVVASLAVLLVAATGLALATVLLSRANQRAAQSLQEAELHLHVAQGTVDDFCSRLSEELADVPGAESVRAAALWKAEQFYRELSDRDTVSPGRAHDAAMASFQRAIVLEQLGQFTEASQAYLRSRVRFAELAERAPQDVRAQAEAALCDAQFALLVARRGDPAFARSLLSGAMRAMALLADAHPTERDLQSDLTLVQSNYAHLLLQDGRDHEARQLLLANERLLRQLVRADESNTEYLGRLAITLEQLASLVKSAAAACPLLSEAATLQEQRLELNPQHLRTTSELAAALHRLGSVQAELGQRGLARSTYTRALRLREDLAMQAPKAIPRQAELAATLNNLGLVQLSDDPALAAESFGKATARLREAVEASPEDFELRSELAVALSNQGAAAEKMGKLRDSVELFQRAVTEQEQAYEKSGRLTRLNDQLRQLRSGLQRVHATAAITNKTEWIQPAEGPAT
ncbi:MAG: protein kinase [Pirellulaceae bacterium]